METLRSGGSSVGPAWESLGSGLGYTTYQSFAAGKMIYLLFALSFLIFKLGIPIVPTS